MVIEKWKEWRIRIDINMDRIMETPANKGGNEQTVTSKPKSTQATF